jgi:cytochrome c
MKPRVGWVISIVATLAAGGAAAQSGDAERGERAFNQQCKICHSVDKGGPNKVGPNLFGVIGRKAGTGASFSYSSAMEKSGIVWGDKALADYLTDPRKVVPGGKMAFVGIKKQDQLDDVIAYLKKATQ